MTLLAQNNTFCPDWYFCPKIKLVIFVCAVEGLLRARFIVLEVLLREVTVRKGRLRSVILIRLSRKTTLLDVRCTPSFAVLLMIHQVADGRVFHLWVTASIGAFYRSLYFRRYVVIVVNLWIQITLSIKFSSKYCYDVVIVRVKSYIFGTIVIKICVTVFIIGEGFGTWVDRCNC